MSSRSPSNTVSAPSISLIQMPGDRGRDELRFIWLSILLDFALSGLAHRGFGRFGLAHSAQIGAMPHLAFESMYDSVLR